MLKPSIDDLINSSFRSVLKNKSRTVLTSLGVIIGVTSVILLTSIGNGLKIYVNQQFEALGSNTIFVSPGKIFNDNGSFSNARGSIMSTSFSEKNLTDLKRGLKTNLIMPLKTVTVEVKSNTTKKSTTLVGTNYLYGPNNNSAPSANRGRWFTKEEEDKKSNVAILGATIATDLFPNGNGLGKKIVVNSKNLKIIGINDKKGSSFGGPSVDEYIFTPFGIAADIAGDQNIQQIVIKAPNKSQIDNTKAKVTKILLEHYDKDAFSVFDSAQLLNSINAIIGTLTVALTGIAAISLVVGGIGIMNIMLVTVSERTKEIGLRKAIGAFPSAILLQFLFEAIILSGLGGFIGIILGSLGTMTINNFFPAKVTLGSIILAFGVSFLVGIIFGVTPARKASKLSPIEALRYE